MRLSPIGESDREFFYAQVSDRDPDRGFDCHMYFGKSICAARYGLDRTKNSHMLFRSGNRASTGGAGPAMALPGRLSNPGRKSKSRGYSSASGNSSASKSYSSQHSSGKSSGSFSPHQYSQSREYSAEPRVVARTNCSQHFYNSSLRFCGILQQPAFTLSSYFILLCKILNKIALSIITSSSPVCASSKSGSLIMYL